MVVLSKSARVAHRLMCAKSTDERRSRNWLAVMLLTGDLALRSCLGGVTTWVILGNIHDRRFTEPMTDKELVLDTVHKLPDDTPLEKISEEIEFLVAVQRGLKALDEGRVVSHEDVKARVASWARRGRK
jgi:hypothetical protein